MYGDAPSSQVVDPQYAADHISSQVVKHQHLPYGLAVGVEDWGGFGDEAIRGGWIVVAVGVFLWEVVEVEDPLNRGCLPLVPMHPTCLEFHAPYQFVCRGESGKRTTWWVVGAALQPDQYSAHLKRLKYCPPLTRPHSYLSCGFPCFCSHSMSSCRFVSFAESLRQQSQQFLYRGSVPLPLAALDSQLLCPLVAFSLTPTHSLFLITTSPGSSDPSIPITHPLLFRILIQGDIGDF